MSNVLVDKRFFWGGRGPLVKGIFNDWNTLPASNHFETRWLYYIAGREVRFGISPLKKEDSQVVSPLVNFITRSRKLIRGQSGREKDVL